MIERRFNKVELLLNMTIGGTVTACLILLIKQLLKNKLTPKWHFYLWIILAVRLLIPGLPESNFSLQNAFPTTQNITTVQNEVPNSSGLADSINSGYVEGNLILKFPAAGMEQQRPFSVPEYRVNVLLAGWITGTVLMIGYLITAYWRFNRRSKKLPECRDAEILELFRECRNDSGIASDNLTLRSGGTTPMLHGVMRPTILIPGGYSKEELRFVLIHELCHYKHKDIIVNIICCAFLCVYWFNPIFWLCFYTIRRDIEILCDERVVEITGERKEYSRTLLKTALKRNQFLFGTTSMQNGEKEVAKRIKHIAYFKKPKLWISVIAILAVFVTGAICLTNSAENTVNLSVADHFVTIPESWLGASFGGISYTKVDLGVDKAKNFESVALPLPDQAVVLERKVLKKDDKTLIIVNLDLLSPEKVNRNYIFLLPDINSDDVYTVWANSSRITERQLLKIANTLQKEPNPQGYQPEAAYQGDWVKTSNKLLREYFKNYVDSEMSMTSDISGYRIDKDSIVPYEDQEASWSLIYPSAVALWVDYTLDITYPDQYSFAGGDFEIGEGNRTKIYKDQLAVFDLDNQGTARFLGFVWPQDRGELGNDQAILRTIGYADPELRPEALIALKIPYIGDHSKVGRIIGSLPLAEYGSGLELHTKEEP
ncbi:MAG TPA: M56 family metallopeptidase, partial [Anaerovoracaceae bacterium]|nr:M56 family metallopeptidase [Anaerovoracaceae bacterium]